MFERQQAEVQHGIDVAGAKLKGVKKEDAGALVAAGTILGVASVAGVIIAAVYFFLQKRRKNSGKPVNKLDHRTFADVAQGVSKDAAPKA